jgi:hypothetical protein
VPALHATTRCVARARLDRDERMPRDAVNAGPRDESHQTRSHDDTRSLCVRSREFNDPEIGSPEF